MTLKEKCIIAIPGWVYYCPLICFHLCLYRLKENTPSWLAPHDHAMIRRCINNTMSCKMVESLCLFIQLSDYWPFCPQGGRSPRSAEEKPLRLNKGVAHGTALGVYYGCLKFFRAYHANTIKWSCEDHVCNSPEISVISSHCSVLLQSLDNDKDLHSSAFPHRS